CTILVPVDGETYGQNISCTFVISDPDDNKCTLTIVQYSKDGGTNWHNASVYSGDTSNLDGDSIGKTYSFVWNSFADLPDTIIQTIRFRIFAFDGIDTGIADTTLNFCIDNLKPDSVAGLVAAADLSLPDTGVLLKWNLVSTADLSGYNIYRDTTGIGNYIKLNLIIISDTSYFDTTAVQGETFYYSVAAVDSYGNESLKTDSVSASSVLIKKYIQSVEISGADTAVKPGATITYYIEYLNNGFAPATDVEIYDTLPAEVSYKISSQDSVSGNAFQIFYSSDNSVSWGYTPFGTTDANVTNLKIMLIGTIPPKIDWPCNGSLKYGTVIK
nr:hypothetical protein [bacterium]